MALDTTTEFFIGDYVYYISQDGSYTAPGEVIKKEESNGSYWYSIDCDGYVYTTDANFISYTL